MQNQIDPTSAFHIGHHMSVFESVIAVVF